MAWYKTGTVSVVNGETSITGTGTKFASNSRVGDGFRGPDGEWYEIVNIASETVLGIFPAYQGGTASTSESYMIAPLQGYNKESADRLREITNGMADISGDVLEAKNSAIEAKASEDAAKAYELSVSASALDVSQKASQVSTDAVQVSQDRTVAQAAASESETARDEAVAAAGLITGTVTDRGAIDLSSGSYPAKPATSSFWRVAVAGTVSGVNYSVGDTLNYSKMTDEFYKSGGAVDSVNGKVGVVVLSKADIDLGNVDNTSDTNKPVSTEQQTALDTKVDKVTGKQLSTEDYTSAEKNKLGSIASEATKNSGDATLLNRANHTGTQLASTVSDLADAVRLVTASGLTLTNAAILSTDTILVALGKAQGQIETKAASGDNNDIMSLRALSADGFDRIRQGIAPMVGATASSDGTKGLVPVASVAERLKVLSGAGTWVALPTGAAWGAITGTLSAQTDLQLALDALSSRVGATMVSVNGGANLAVNQIYTVTNPFPNETIICEAQVLFSGVWANPRWFASGAATTYGTTAGQRFSTTAPGDIYVRTGTSAMTVEPSASGSAFAAGMGNQAALPCRVLVWRVKS